MGGVQNELRLHIDFLGEKKNKKTHTPCFKFNLKFALPLDME